MREGIDVEHAPGDFLRRAENSLPGQNARIVNQDGGPAERGADFGRGLGDGRRGGDVAFVEADAIGERVCRRSDVQDGDFDSACAEELRDALADAAAAAG